MFFGEEIRSTKFTSSVAVVAVFCHFVMVLQCFSSGFHHSGMVFVAAHLLCSI